MWLARQNNPETFSILAVLLCIITLGVGWGGGEAWQWVGGGVGRIRG